MTTSNAEGLASTPKWIGLSLLRFTAEVIIWGLIMLAFGSLSLYVVGFIYPESMPYVWLAIVGTTISLLGFQPDEESQAWIQGIINTTVELNRAEQFIYAASLALIVIGIVFAQITTIGVVSAIIFQETSLTIVAIAAAVFLPPTDAWLGRNYNVSIGAVGFIIAVSIMRLVAMAYQVSPDVVSRASHDFHSAMA